MLTRECCQRRKEDLLFKEVLNRSYYNFEQEGLYTCIASYIFYELKESSHQYTFIIIGFWNKWFKMYVKRFLYFISTFCLFQSYPIITARFTFDEIVDKLSVMHFVDNLFLNYTVSQYFTSISTYLIKFRMILQKGLTCIRLVLNFIFDYIKDKFLC